MKKILSILLAAALIVCTFAACGNKKTDTSSDLAYVCLLYTSFLAFGRCGLCFVLALSPALVAEADTVQSILQMCIRDRVPPVSFRSKSMTLRSLRGSGTSRAPVPCPYGGRALPVWAEPHATAAGVWVKCKNPACLLFGIKKRRFPSQ